MTRCTRPGRNPAHALDPRHGDAWRAALLLFGPEQLPKVARKAGSVMRDIQNTSQSFIREMERAPTSRTSPRRKPSRRRTNPRLRSRAVRRDPGGPGRRWYGSIRTRTVRCHGASGNCGVRAAARIPRRPRGEAGVASPKRWPNRDPRSRRRSRQFPQRRRHKPITRRTSSRVSRYGGTPWYRSTAPAPRCTPRSRARRLPSGQVRVVAEQRGEVNDRPVQVAPHRRDPR